jgi:WD40 repeat protein
VTGGDLTSRQINSDAQVVDDALAFSPDGSVLAGAGCGPDEADGGCLAGTVWLWDVDSGEQLGGPLILDETAFVFSLAFTSAGQYLITADGTGAINLWKVATGERVLQIPAHTGPVPTLGFSHDGRLLASGGIDHVINLFNVDRLLAQVERTSSERIDEACQRAGRNLSSEEWSSFFGDIPYRATCPGNNF